MKKITVMVAVLWLIIPATVKAECWGYRDYRYNDYRYYDYRYYYNGYGYYGYYGYTQLDGVMVGIRLGQMVSESVDRALAPVTSQQPTETTIWHETPTKNYWERWGQKFTIGKSPPWVGKRDP